VYTPKHPQQALASFFFMREPATKAPVTALLLRWREGDREALDQLLPLVYQDLLRLAQHRARSLPSGSTLDSSALVNEVFLRLVGGVDISWQDRAHFFAVVATLMRQVAIDQARARSRLKRGGASTPITLDDAASTCLPRDETLLALDGALDELAQLDARKAKVVELRFFAGMSNLEIAEALSVSVDTVKRDWSFSKLWLARRMEGPAA
jgi:RNA polymerase sigma-70 factor, ECF subfamily